MRILILLLSCFTLLSCFEGPDDPMETFNEVSNSFDELNEKIEELETDFEDAIDIIGRQQVYLSHQKNEDGFVIPNTSTLEITLSQVEARPYGRKNGQERLKVDAQIRCTGDIPFTNNNLKNNPYYEEYNYSSLECTGSFADVFKNDNKIQTKLKRLYIRYNSCTKEFIFFVIGTEDDLIILSQKGIIPEEIGEALNEQH